jgi:hypothetical protein
MRAGHDRHGEDAPARVDEPATSGGEDRAEKSTRTRRSRGGGRVAGSALAINILAMPIAFIAFISLQRPARLDRREASA